MTHIDGDFQPPAPQERRGFLETVGTIGDRVRKMLRDRFARFGNFGSERRPQTIEMSVNFDDENKTVTITLYRGKNHINSVFDFSEDKTTVTPYETFYYYGEMQFEAFKKLWTNKGRVFSLEELGINMDNLRDINTKLVRAGIANIIHIRGREYGQVDVITTENPSVNQNKVKEEGGLHPFQIDGGAYIHTNFDEPLPGTKGPIGDVRFINHFDNEKTPQDGAMLVTGEYTFSFKEKDDYAGVKAGEITFIESMDGGKIDIIRYSNGTEKLLNSRISEIILYKLMIRRNQPLKISTLLGDEGKEVQAFADNEDPAINGGIDEVRFRQLLDYFGVSTLDEFYDTIAECVAELMAFEKPAGLTIETSNMDIDWDTQLTFVTLAPEDIY